MFTGWMSFGGTEIVNEARLAVYVKALSIPGFNCQECDGLADALEETYVDPATDNAPWYDPAIPESAQVAGFQIVASDSGVGVQGLGDTGTRSVSEFARDGGVVGRRRRTTRTISFSVRAVASTECALNYATAWLSRVLRGQECSPISFDVTEFIPPIDIACAGSQMCFLRCCPQTPEDIDTYLVTLFGVGVIEGPSPVQRYATLTSGTGCGVAMCDSELTLVAGDPGFYGAPFTVFDEDLLPNFKGRAGINMLSDCVLTPGVPGEENRCVLTDVPEDCVSTEQPIAYDPPSPCVGPVALGGINNYNVYSIPFDLSTFGSFYDLVPVIYYTGSGMGSNGSSQENNYEGPVVIRIRRVTPETPCGFLNIEDPCETMEIVSPMFSAGKTNVLNWVARRGYRIDSTIDLCPFAVYTRQLLPFDWQTLVCAPQMCMDIYVYADRDGRDASIRMDIMRRQDALC